MQQHGIELEFSTDDVRDHEVAHETAGEEEEIVKMDDVLYFLK